MKVFPRVTAETLWKKRTVLHTVYSVPCSAGSRTLSPTVRNPVPVGGALGALAVGLSGLEFGCRGTPGERALAVVLQEQPMTTGWWCGGQASGTPEDALASAGTAWDVGADWGRGHPWGVRGEGGGRGELWPLGSRSTGSPAPQALSALAGAEDGSAGDNGISGPGQVLRAAESDPGPLCGVGWPAACLACGPPPWLAWVRGVRDSQF